MRLQPDRQLCMDINVLDLKLRVWQVDALDLASSLHREVVRATGDWGCPSLLLQLPLANTCSSFSQSRHFSLCLSLHSPALQACGPGDEKHTGPSCESHPNTPSQGGQGTFPVLRQQGFSLGVLGFSCPETDTDLLPAHHLCHFSATPSGRMQRDKRSHSVGCSEDK